MAMDMERYKNILKESDLYMKSYFSMYMESGAKDIRYLASLYESLIELAVLINEGEETPRLIELGVRWETSLNERKKAIKKRK